MHECNFKPVRRLGNIVRYKCKCGKTKNTLIKNFNKEMSDEIDAKIKGAK